MLLQKKYVGLLGYSRSKWSNKATILMCVTQLKLTKTGEPGSPTEFES
jgi:hypothetical protein